MNKFFFSLIGMITCLHAFAGEKLMTGCPLAAVQQFPFDLLIKDKVVNIN